jgi:hypothetical protein
MREYFGIERAGGRFVDSEDLVLEFEALLNNLKAELESEQERLASVGGKLSPFKQRQLEELLRKNAQDAGSQHSRVLGFKVEVGCWCSTVETAEDVESHIG